MLKSPITIAIGAAALWLALSPDARKTARKWAVKATEYALDLSEQARNAAADVRGRIQSATEEKVQGEKS